MNDLPRIAPALLELCQESVTTDLGPGTPNEKARPRLEALNVPDSFEPDVVVDDLHAQACLAGLWLRHHFLDTSHEISQRIDSDPTGSFWHAIMHRREGDFGNSKYWFSRAGDHPACADITREVMKLPDHDGFPRAKQALAGDGWDAAGFVDAVQEALDSRDSAKITFLQAVQEIEWDCLFRFCYEQAVGRLDPQGRNPVDV
ncbi:MAG: hypothetical protein ACFE0O_14570 [Opitutales bacterium]